MRAETPINQRGHAGNQRTGGRKTNAGRAASTGSTDKPRPFWSQPYARKKQRKKNRTSFYGRSGSILLLLSWFAACPPPTFRISVVPLAGSPPERYQQQQSPLSIRPAASPPPHPPAAGYHAITSLVDTSRPCSISTGARPSAPSHAILQIWPGTHALSLVSRLSRPPLCHGDLTAILRQWHPIIL